MMSYLNWGAYNALGDVSVEVLDLWGYPGVFEVGETAFLDISITNNSGLKLSDVVVTVEIDGPVAIDPIVFWGIPCFDGEWSCDEIEPSEQKEMSVKFCQDTPWDDLDQSSTSIQ